MFLVSLLVLVISILSLWLYKKYQPYFETIKHVKKHRSGMTWEVLKMNFDNGFELATKLMKGYETCFYGPMFLQCVRDPEDLQIVLNSEATFEKTIFNKLFFKFGLLTEGGPEYKERRKTTVVPLFTASRLRQITPILNQIFTDFLNLYETKLRVPEEVDFNHIAAYFTLSSSLYTIFNIDIKDEETLSKIIEQFRQLSIKNAELILKPFMWSDFMLKYSPLGKDLWNLKMATFRTQKLDQIKLTEDHERDGMKFYYDLISKTEFNPNTEEYIERTSLLMAASYESSGLTISNTLLLLGMHPEKQEVLYNEIKSVLQSADDYVTHDVVDQLKYLDLVIKETLRLLPPSPMLARKVTSDLKLTRYTARAGSVISVPVLEVHKDKNIWGEDADEFKPERFLDENMESIHPYAYLPFSKGARICPGYKMAALTVKIFICRFLLKYRVSTPLKLDELYIRLSVVMNIKQGHMIKCEERE